MPQAIIERPRCVRNNYRSAKSIPGLSPKEQALLLTTKNALIDKYFDKTKTWTMQDLKAKAEAVAEALERLPFLARYESVWPLEALLRESLISLASLSRRGKGALTPVSRRKHRVAAGKEVAGKERAVKKRVPKADKTQQDAETKEEEMNEETVPKTMSTPEATPEPTLEPVRLFIRLPGIATLKNSAASDEQGVFEPDESDYDMEGGSQIDELENDEVEEALYACGSESSHSTNYSSVKSGPNEPGHVGPSTPTSMQLDIAADSEHSSMGSEKLPQSGCGTPSPIHDDSSSLSPFSRAPSTMPSDKQKQDVSVNNGSERGALSSSPEQQAASIFVDPDLHFWESLSVQHGLSDATEKSPPEGQLTSCTTGDTGDTSDDRASSPAPPELMRSNSPHNDEQASQPAASSSTCTIGSSNSQLLPNSGGLVTEPEQEHLAMESSTARPNSQTPLSHQGSCIPSFPNDILPKPANYIQTFLRSLRPPMDVLMSKFIDGGISDEKCLDGLAAMPEEDLREFLRTDLGLNPFQAKIVRIALRPRVQTVESSPAPATPGQVKSQAH